jgi:hypothetical protein
LKRHDDGELFVRDVLMTAQDVVDARARARVVENKSATWTGKEFGEGTEGSER